jgi:hypothetical protein
MKTFRYVGPKSVDYLLNEEISSSPPVSELVCRLYGLTKDELKIVEETNVVSR